MPEDTREKILIVADEPDTAIFLSNLLCSGGFNPLVAEDRSHVLIRTRDEKPLVVIIDMMIAGEGGIKMYGELKDDEGLMKIPVIMLSTIDRKTFFMFQKSRKLPSGRSMPPPEAYLQKPPETDELLEIVRMLAHGGDRDLKTGNQQGEEMSGRTDGGANVH